MGKFRQINTELLPLIMLIIGFGALSWAFDDRFSSNIVYELILGKIGL